MVEVGRVVAVVVEVGRVVVVVIEVGSGSGRGR